jgi:hypothetical protein
VVVVPCTKFLPLSGAELVPKFTSFKRELGAARYIRAAAGLSGGPGEAGHASLPPL